MTTHRCAILDDYQQVALASADWRSLGDRVTVESFPDSIGDRDALARRLAPYTIVVAMRERTRIDRALLERLPALKLLVTTAMRNNAIDLAAAAERGVTVCGTGGYPGAAAELTWALIHAITRHIPHEAQGMREGRWQTTIGRALHGATLGVIGMGRIGAQVAAVGRVFGMDVVGWSRSFTPEKAAQAGIRHGASVDEIVAQSDILTLHLSLNADTRGIIGAAQLAKMKPDALLINTARGPIVDEAALLAALSSGRLGGAALDVYDREPLPADHPLRSMRNVVLTPHIGYVTREQYRVFYGNAVEDVRAWLAGAPVRVLN
jgi:phosphoglycerate dehydrogenase-like enzyme